MERSSVLRLLLIAGFGLLMYFVVLPKFTGGDTKVQHVPEEKYQDAPGFAPDTVEGKGGAPPSEGQLCKIDGTRFDATLSTRGAAITHYHLEGGKYEGMDISTTPDQERWRSLRTLFRGPEGGDQVAFDRFDWKLAAQDGKSCTFEYADENVKIVKKVAASDRPFELVVDTSVTNLAKEPKKHTFSISAHAYRLLKETKGGFGRQAPFTMELACASGKDLVKKGRDDFEPGWFAVPGVDRYAAVSSHYFSQALVPTTEPARCEILAEDWLAPGQKRGDDDAPTVYHAKLVYPAKTLAPNETATYQEIAFFGPKERDVLANAAGANGKLNDLISVSGWFTFTPVVRALVSVLRFFYGIIGNWGISIIAMTICLKLVLFPLSLKQIKTTIAMRRLKPEIDKVNEKFKDDAQAKQLAMMEMYKKFGVNPFGGCLPQLVQMPIWFAMYATLQTAIEMYHVKFLWFADLSQPDKFFILPLVLGALMIVQQRIVPQQPGMDPVQQKMMMYMLPIVFTVMMLFLPAALGVYMLTNSCLGILQQVVVEQIAPRSDSDKGEGTADKGGKGKGGGDKIVVKQLGKGKARV